jgi:hypothetical protein
MATLSPDSIQTATVEAFGKVKPSQFGDSEFQSVLFKTATGEQIWKSYTVRSPELSQLKKGQRVTLLYRGLKHGKPSYDVVIGLLSGQAEAVPPIPSPSTAPSPVTDDAKRTIARDIETSAKLYRFCLETARNQVGELLGNDLALVKDVATTLFIQSLR